MSRYKKLEPLRQKVHEVLEGVDVADCIETLTVVMIDFYEKYCIDNIELTLFLFDNLDTILAIIVSGKKAEELEKLLEKWDELGQQQWQP